MRRPRGSTARSSSRSSKTSSRTKHFSSRGTADPDGSAVVPLGLLVAGHGVRGLARIKPFHTESPVLRSSPHLWLRHPDGRRARFAILERRPHKGVVLVKLAGIDSLDALTPWLRSVVEIEREELPAPMESEIYTFEAVGLTVRSVAGEVLGEIEDTMTLPANDVWVVKRPDGRELLIPVIESVVVEVDLVARCATIDPLPGLIEE